MKNRAYLFVVAGYFILAIVVLSLILLTVSRGLFARPDQSQQTAAQRLFDMRCAGAGEFIYRTAANVDGVFLLKLREKRSSFSEQFSMDDPYGSDLSGDGYIKSFLKGKYENSGRPDLAARAYSFVEVFDLKDGKQYRYSGYRKIVGRQEATAPNVKINLRNDPNYDLNIYENALSRVGIKSPRSNYGVTYADISTVEDRRNWIAGSRLQVIELSTKSVIAERIGYMMDPGQGETGGGRSPWLQAAGYACPGFTGDGRRTYGLPGAMSLQINQTIRFVGKVLKPSQAK